MRCTQPYISQAGKFGQQIWRSHSWGISNPNLSQQIASKYGSFKLGRFPLATLTLLQQANSENAIANTIQIFKNRTINVLPAANQLNISLHLSCGNAPIQKLEQKLFRNCLANSITIVKSFQRASHKLTNTIASNAVRWLERTTLSNITFVPLSPNAEVNKKWRTATEVAHPRSQLVIKRRLDLNTKLIPLTKAHTNRLLGFVRRDDKDGKTNYPSAKQNVELRPNFSALSVKSSLKAEPSDNHPVSLVASNSDRNWTPDVYTKLTKTQTSLLIDAVTTNWNISTFERKFDLWTKQDNSQPQPVLKTQKTALDPDNELRLVSRQRGDWTSCLKSSVPYRHIRTRRFNQLANELILKRVDRTAASIQNRQKHYPFSQATTMELAQSPPSVKSISTTRQEQKEIERGWQAAKPTNIDTFSVDVNSIAERVFQVMERKLKTERQRRGIL